ncbi:Vitamin D3 receptor B-like protein [Dinothrombium tinctorium]|uniref:Vitamin D3 receptor B-like protein n=1 Tax=Dinothrombium tinctorium TaxID=1965070 RepID=A0A3S3P4M2_9ACAR|nr:Vitamin D3 receptor B-like protein [Dinothrombium tinctorium]
MSESEAKGDGIFAVIGDEKHTSLKPLKAPIPQWFRNAIAFEKDVKKCKSDEYDIECLRPFLDQFLIEKLKEKGIRKFFPVQKAVIPYLVSQFQSCHLRRMRDVCVSSPTGSENFRGSKRALRKPRAALADIASMTPEFGAGELRVAAQEPQFSRTRRKHLLKVNRAEDGRAETVRELEIPSKAVGSNVLAATRARSDENGAFPIGRQDRNLSRSALWDSERLSPNVTTVMSLPSPDGSTSSILSSEDSTSSSSAPKARQHNHHHFHHSRRTSHPSQPLPSSASLMVGPSVSQLSSRPVKICGVCGDRAKSYHFGGISCDSCKAFFRRSVQNDAYKNFHCPYEGQCDITIMSRKCCQHCR